MTHATDRLIGRTKDGGRLFISIEIRHKEPQYTTTGDPIIRMTRDHRDITEYDELSITGAWVPKYCRDAQTFGQITYALDDLDMNTATIPADMVRDLRRLWRDSHLNGLHAGCIHQDEDHVGRDWEAYAAEQTAKCPQGYRYGSRWLVEILSDGDVSRAREIAAALNEQPEYQGN